MKSVSVSTLFNHPHLTHGSTQRKFTRMKIRKGLPVLAAGSLIVATFALLSVDSAPLVGSTLVFQGGAITSSQLSQLLMRGNYPVTSNYTPAYGHAGVDFGSTGNGITSVYAPVSGTISANTSDCGKVAIFNGRHTIILAHMTSRTSLAVGSQIKAGTYVGKASNVVGAGCRATAAHLHIEIRTDSRVSMADPARDNSGTTLNPLTYQYDTTAPSITIKSPVGGSSFYIGRSYTISWSATDPSGVGDVAVDLISGSATTCYGAASLRSIRLAGSGYVSSVQWTTPTSVSRGSYKLKVAVRDNLNNWGCTTIPVYVR